MTEKEAKNQRAITLILAYPFAILLIGVVLNWFVFGVKAPVIALPSIEYIFSLVLSAALLIINHTWIMTSTELTRARYKMYATPEEWTASGTSRDEVSKEGLRELERRHNAHRNTTENTVYFVLLAFIFAFVSPANIAVQAWIIGFAVARLGYTFSYLSGNDDARGVFMSLSLLSLFGMASYLLMSLVV